MSTWPRYLQALAAYALIGLVVVVGTEIVKRLDPGFKG